MEKKKRNFYITSRESSLEDFTKGEQFVIPVYQRPYSWGEEQITSLIHSIRDGFNNEEEHQEEIFIGTVQINKVEGKEEKEIIDGQQRLTTLMMILNILSNNGESKEYKFIKETKVNNEIQNMFLQNYYNSEIYIEESKKEANCYRKNLEIIKGKVEELIEEDIEKEKLIDYIYNKLFFIILETEKCGLSKTIKIFNTINSTGLDLANSDMFKIRFYEYLTEKSEDEKRSSEEIFNEINKLYNKTDENNLHFDYILTVYKDYLISKYDLANVLYSHSNDRFYDSIFNILISKEKIKGYNEEKIKQIKLNIEDIKRVIDEVVRLEEQIDKNYELMKNYLLLSWSRYPRINRIICLYMLSKEKEEEVEGGYSEKLHSILKIITKNAVFNSFVYKKIISRKNIRFQEIFKSFYNGNLEEKLEEIENDYNPDINGWELNVYKYVSEGNVFGILKVRDLFCRFSELLLEEKNFENMTEEKIRELRQQKIFYWKEIDIEHVHPRNPTKEKDRWEEEILNSIGNLAMLESKINRSISNKSFEEKKEKYKESKYLQVNEIAGNDNWNEEDAQARSRYLVKKLNEYILGRSEV